MVTSISSGGESLTASFYRQGLQREAQRNADRAEAEARSLAASARSARVVADRAQERARGIQVQADRATDDAGRARQGVAALRSSAETRTNLGARLEQVAETLDRREATAPPVNNAAAPAEPSGPIGGLIDVKA